MPRVSGVRRAQASSAGTARLRGHTEMLDNESETTRSWRSLYLIRIVGKAEGRFSVEVHVHAWY